MTDSNLSIPRFFTVLRCTRRLSIAAALAVSSIALTQNAIAQTETQASVVSRYVPGTIQSDEMADAALADTVRERSRIDAQFTHEEAVCHDKFFATSCVEGAKERRRESLRQLRRVEIEANAFKRKSRVAQRDEELAKRQADEQAKRTERATPPDPNARAEAMQLPQEMRQDKNAGVAQEQRPSDRVLQHEARMKQLQAEEQQKAAQRAENVATFERKVQAAKERQQEVEKRKAEKEDKRRAKGAEAAAAVEGKQ